MNRAPPTRTTHHAKLKLDRARFLNGVDLADLVMLGLYDPSNAPLSRAYECRQRASFYRSLVEVMRTLVLFEPGDDGENTRHAIVEVLRSRTDLPEDDVKRFGWRSAPTKKGYEDFGRLESNWKSQADDLERQADDFDRKAGDARRGGSRLYDSAAEGHCAAMIQLIMWKKALAAIELHPSGPPTAIAGILTESLGFRGEDAKREIASVVKRVQSRNLRTNTTRAWAIVEGLRPKVDATALEVPRLERLSTRSQQRLVKDAASRSP